MPSSLQAPDARVTLEPLTPASFAAFGTVIQNPDKASYPHARQSHAANQGSAVKYPDISALISSYEMSKSTKPAVPRVSLFSCKPRTLREESSGKQIFDVKNLERHPFTPQTFVPLALGPTEADRAYLVLVAPTLPLSRSAPMLDEFREMRSPPYPVPERERRPTLRQRLLGGRPNPFTNDYKLTTTPSSLPSSDPIAISTITPRGPGAPDLENLKAFIARGDQAVTYGAGTWHAPMIALGKEPIDFVVFQYMNGVEPEDCQEVELSGGNLCVEIGPGVTSTNRQSKL